MRYNDYGGITMLVSERNQLISLPRGQKFDSKMVNLIVACITTPAECAAVNVTGTGDKIQLAPTKRKLIHGNFPL